MSKLTDYGTVVMTYLARNASGVHNATEIAEAAQLPPATASKILKMLAKAGLLESHRGTKGGYSLARPAPEISVAEIIDAMEGPIGLTECSTAAGLCEQESSCSVRPNWVKINQVVHRALAGITLAEMIEPQRVPINVERINFSARAKAV